MSEASSIIWLFEAKSLASNIKKEVSKKKSITGGGINEIFVFGELPANIRP